MPSATPTAAIAVELVVLTIRDDELRVLITRRQVPPFRDHWALPGRHVGEDEDLVTAAQRELEGLPVPHLEQVATYGDPRRDPSGRVVGVAYLALTPLGAAATDTPTNRWASVSELLDQPSATSALAFDHHKILADGVERARAKLEYTPLAAAFCSETFTVSELRHVYEVIWSRRLDPRNFHRKATSTAGFLAPIGARTTRDGGRPAELYRVGSASTLHPPLTRPS
ncbi:MAG: NUDIX hydrolase [Acidimicrobiales bacterium]